MTLGGIGSGEYERERLVERHTAHLNTMTELGLLNKISKIDTKEGSGSIGKLSSEDKKIGGPGQGGTCSEVNPPSDPANVGRCRGEASKHSFRSPNA